MRKSLSIMLALVMAFSAVACSKADTTNDVTNTAESATESTTTEPTQPRTNIISFEQKDEFDHILSSYKFEGIVYLTKDNQVLYQSATGAFEGENEITIDTPMPLGSVSKQFCATAIMILSEQGKLSVDDKLSMYFPEYENGKDITIKNLLTMRSGVPDMANSDVVNEISANKSYQENTEILKNWIFNQPLEFEPDGGSVYSNTNYFLLSNIVEQISGKLYIDFIREEIFEPLGMQNTYSIEEVIDNPELVNGVKFNSVEDGTKKGFTKGAGDLVSNVYDMDKWMTGLRSGKLISTKSYNEMITNYSDNTVASYGYGLVPNMCDGVGHVGVIANYTACDYFDDDNGYNLFIASNSVTPRKIELTLEALTGLIPR